MNLWMLMAGLAALLFVVALAGCPKPPPPVGVIPADLADLATSPDLTLPEGIASCPTGITITPEDTCEGLATEDGTQCVSCPGSGGCLHEAAQVYCARGGCALDPRCKSDPDFRPALRNEGKGKRPRGKK